ncbi:MAG: hypothetical protein M1609_10025 [Firmicutes bacterium]|nr:hypothetical protein [Bacillota bacterium]
MEEQKINLDLIVEYFAALSNIDTEMTREQQRTMIQALFPKIIIDKNGNMRITARVPIGENFFSDLTGSLNQGAGFYLPSSVQGVRRNRQKRSAKGLCLFLRGVSPGALR